MFGTSLVGSPEDNANALSKNHSKFHSIYDDSALDHIEELGSQGKVAVKEYNQPTVSRINMRY